MGEVKHTRGWTVEGTDARDGCPFIQVVSGEAGTDSFSFVCEVYAAGEDASVLTEPDHERARLIAASPDLLGALRVARSALTMMTQPFAIERTTVLDAYTHAVEAEAKARAAIAKATGSDQ